PGAGRPPLPHLGWPGDAEDLPRVVDAGRDIGATFPPLSHPIGLYAVVGSVDWVRRCVELRVDTVQLRVKDLPAPALRHAVAESVAATGGSSTRLFVNDFWREAIDAGAYGVHLGQEDLTDADLPAIAAAGLRLGVSTHSYYEIARAHAIAPSYVAIGPIFATTTKPMKFAPQGIARLRRWVNLLKPRYPLTAIGGIDVERVSGVMASGVGSIAVVRAITEAADPAVAVADLRAAMHSDHADVR
ncbi:MAG: thiamine phosphate synthase, partial [Gammaproteobacteria bacterium]|nr:thiamine phosphate synthase [Gammaproteobacteria bacterium]